jgi:hypothetical protein
MEESLMKKQTLNHRPVRRGVSKGEEDGRRRPARSAYKGRAWRARIKLQGVRGYPFPYGPAESPMMEESATNNAD